MEALLRNDCGYSDIAQNIISQLHGFDLFQLSRVTKGIQRTILEQVWDARKAFSTHFENFEDIALLLKACHGIISGSAALGFFDGTGSTLAGDVDIYMQMPMPGLLVYQPEHIKETILPYKANIMTVGKHLMEREGYEFVEQEPPFRACVPLQEPNPTIFDLFEHEILYGRDDSDPNEYDDNPIITRVFNFVRPSDKKKVQIIAVDKEPHYALLYFHSTVVCNFLTPTHAISLFPRETFKNRELKLIHLDGHQREAPWHLIDKYRARGWHIDRGKTIEEDATFGSALGEVKKVMKRFRGDGTLQRTMSALVKVHDRHFGDYKCWVIPLKLLEELEEDEMTVWPPGSFKWMEAVVPTVDSGLYTALSINGDYHKGSAKLN